MGHANGIQEVLLVLRRSCSIRAVVCKIHVELMQYDIPFTSIMSTRRELLLPFQLPAWLELPFHLPVRVAGKRAPPTNKCRLTSEYSTGT